MNKYKAPALEKGLDILEYLSNKALPQTQTEIAIGLNKSPNEIYRMLACLEYRKYIQKLSTGQYALSMKMYQLSHRHSPVEGLTRTAKQHMDDLANKTNQSCHLSILHYGDLLVVSQSKSPGSVSLSIKEGSLFPLLQTSSGKVLLAFENEQKREHLLESNPFYNSQNSTFKKQFLKDLQKINKSGHNISSSELTLGVTDIAVPIFGINNEILCVLAISSIQPITKNVDTTLLLNELKNTATKINNELG
ncbi:transcriptional regulator [Galbibacter orientalis DSM 19592]|uniref:Transcriptional regulator n=1 Tax=Galbibacter orientalis DSM 19592 TaxID=926559 RepID=I3CAS6_9FLAO|nr:IclR family transcriptional regulator [Galbibacter orientalis]EIJ40719.1 transcriptional regulator [Galbibacter orientalis DSM 19592]